MHAKAYSALSPTTKPLAFLLRTLPPECVQKTWSWLSSGPSWLMPGAPPSWARAGLGRRRVARVDGRECREGPHAIQPGSV